MFLITLPLSVLAQDAEQGTNESDGYYLKSSEQFAPSSNHIVPSQSRLRSNRKGVDQSAPVVKSTTIQFAETAEAPTKAVSVLQQATKLKPTEEIEFSAPKLSALDYLVGRDSLIPNKVEIQPSIQQTAQHQEVSGGDFNPHASIRVASRQDIQEVELVAPKVAPDYFSGSNDVVKPSPRNTSQAVDDPYRRPVNNTRSQPVAEQRFNENTVEQAPVRPDPVSLDEIMMSQRVNSWEQQRPSTMRNVGDHFSPGGEPFAIRGIAGNPTFFGVDRHTCCDEWEGFSNCGGLKANPGHLGIPWLRSKENCDSATGCLGKHRSRKTANSCDCARCRQK